MTNKITCPCGKPHKKTPLPDQFGSGSPAAAYRQQIHLYARDLIDDVSVPLVNGSWIVPGEERRQVQSHELFPRTLDPGPDDQAAERYRLLYQQAPPPPQLRPGGLVPGSQHWGRRPTPAEDLNAAAMREMRLRRPLDEHVLAVRAAWLDALHEQDTTFGTSHQVTDLGVVRLPGRGGQLTRGFPVVINVTGSTDGIPARMELLRARVTWRGGQRLLLLASSLPEAGQADNVSGWWAEYVNDDAPASPWYRCSASGGRGPRLDVIQR